ncbi:uncharacterized protein TRIADDRAFT_56125 [Trichoplax adhaerens]|uniref:Ubiquitin carboxyl-terminal hydrolase n=1 Tax=Trichoplax adhaerens TaxID=10228 RepID=B3RX91_TRIAD|nr:hypothetical protein TRIADDRAFT_56125 [Trichoplax adhaerens]EDV24829.1 hypothetical protein TRIADDRAFT_56125 [Trichoplax adhaerens]|eukprot:XP_002112719.1 hypothetical protein TRIADDRAFT_56125 [Trichoplax adhaerens]
MSGQTSRWLPLESNPEFAYALGVPKAWQFVDVFGLDDELLAFLPQPVVALLVLFPITSKYENYITDEVNRLGTQGQFVGDDVYFMKQTIGNACGTIALIHAFGNNSANVQLDNGYLKEFLQATANMNAVERAAYLENDNEITSAHEACAHEGQTQAPSVNEEVNLHYVALVQNGGHLYELDGRKPFPINHGSSSPESFLKDAAKVCQSLMQRDPTEVNFSIIALAQA